jgi:hypothetical protein
MTEETFSTLLLLALRCFVPDDPSHQIRDVMACSFRIARSLPLINRRFNELTGDVLLDAPLKLQGATQVIASTRSRDVDRFFQFVARNIEEQAVKGWKMASQSLMREAGNPKHVSETRKRPFRILGTRRDFTQFEDFSS